MKLLSGIANEARRNMDERFVDNPHRGLMIGMSPEKRAVFQAVWIMGRSPGSQNRRYGDDKGVVKTEVADETTHKGDPPLTIHPTMISYEGAHVISNGDQTKTIVDSIKDIGLPSLDAFNEALKSRFTEPDFPYFTPRISAMYVCYFGGTIYLSVLKADVGLKEDWNKAQREVVKANPGLSRDEVKAKVSKKTGLNPDAFPTIRSTYERILHPGYGFCLTTYAPGDHENLPSFEGEPFIIPVHEGLEKTMISIMSELEYKWFSGMVGKEIFPDGGRYRLQFHNKHEKVLK